MKWLTAFVLLALLPLLSLSARAQGGDSDTPQIEQGDVPDGGDSAAPAEDAAPADDQPQDEPAEPEHIAPSDPAPGAPAIPSINDVLQNKGKATINNYVPLNLDFRVGLIGDYEEKVEAYDGATTTNTKSPLILLDPSSGSIKVHARNFPAQIIANSDNGLWVIGIAPSAAVEGTSGSSSKQAAVSLNMSTGEIKLITEFPIHSNFQALFLNNEKDTVLYCVNEPGAVNQMIKYSLDTRVGTPLPAEGNRFYMYGLRQSQGTPTGIWVKDPRSVETYPVVSLLDLKAGSQVDHVEFPGTSEIMARPDGTTLLASIKDHSEASLGYYETSTHDYKQIDDLVFTSPQIKWTHKHDAVIVKESTSTKDRFVWVDLQTGKARELFSAIFTIGAWDVSPNDDALVFVANAKSNPVLFVLPLDDNAKTVNRIKLNDMTGVTWLGCLNTPQGESSSGGKGGAKGPMKWIDRLIPRF